MKFKAEIDVMPLEELLDPQGKVVQGNLDKLGITHVGKVRIGKHIRLELEADSEAEATEKVEAACKKFLANLIMENYAFTIHKS
ncbi:MAG: phosphoribosylformylglycinamidine synthase subunit PurS [Bacteroidia bacterium]